MVNWVALAVRRDVVLRGVRVAGLVGTILVAINHGDNLLAGNLDLAAVWKMALTYVVPYCVSTYASVAALRNAADGTMP